MITVNNLHKRFKKFQALKGIDLQVRPGEVYGFIGQNGAGKSTTMNILTGLSRPTAGRCLVNGKDISRITHPSELHIGYLPENPQFYPWMTAYETLQYLGNSGADRVSNARIQQMLDWVGLAAAARRRVGGFSRGMKQRLGIAAALIHDAELLILDEPSSALDPEGRSDVLRLIQELKQVGKTVFFSTHILSDVERVCDTVGIIAAGRMVLQKPLQELLSEHIAPVFDIQLFTPPSVGLVDQLRQVPEVLQVATNGDSLTVTVKDAAAAGKQLLCWLCEHGLTVRQLSLRKRDLEQVFIKEVNSDER
ncbi:MAG: ABC transporter ATP-binding protein [Bacillota bacterium]|jgi:ABC-2 type transport system ATP-binding protein